MSFLGKVLFFLQSYYLFWADTHLLIFFPGKMTHISIIEKEGNDGKDQCHRGETQAIHHRDPINFQTWVPKNINNLDKGKTMKIIPLNIITCVVTVKSMKFS